MLTNLRKMMWAVGLTAFLLTIALPAKSQIFAKKETDPTAQYKVKDRSGGDYVYKSGGKRYNSAKKKYDYTAGSWVKRKDGYRGSMKSFSKPRYNIKSPKTPRQRNDRKKRQRKADAGEHPSDAGHTTM